MRELREAKHRPRQVEGSQLKGKHAVTHHLLEYLSKFLSRPSRSLKALDKLFLRIKELHLETDKAVARLTPFLFKRICLRFLTLFGTIQV